MNTLDILALKSLICFLSGRVKKVGMWSFNEQNCEFHQENEESENLVHHLMIPKRSK